LGIGHIVNLGINRINNRDTLTADLNYSAPINQVTNYELFLTRDRVETRNALIEGIVYNFYGVSIENRIAPRWTVIGLLGSQEFTDDNQERMDV